jgi:hypothetical protein
MKEFSHYTDEDFQNYFDKSFTGDVKFFENHLRECELCNKNFEVYSLVWLFAKNDLQTEPLRMDLAYAVANKVFAIKESKPVFEKVMYGLLICLGLVSLSLCFNFLLSSSIPTPFILLAIPVGLFLWVNYKEVTIIEQRFAAQYEEIRV